MMISTSSLPLPDILDDNEKVELEVLAGIRQAQEKFAAKELFPELMVVYETALRCKKVLIKQDHIWLIFNSIGSVDQIDVLRKLYQPTDLKQVRTADNLNTLLNFTAWLNKQYADLVKKGEPLSLQVTNDLRFSIRGLWLNSLSGLLFVHYRDVNNVTRSQIFSYKRYVEKVGESTDVSNFITMRNNVTVDLYRHVDDDHRRNNSVFLSPSESLAAVSSRIPASFKATTLPIIRKSLLRLISLSRK
ncbi:MAG: hypothetical protein WD335_03275 [Candidatus Paceibacterota bacterium]